MRLIDADAALKALRKCQTYLYDARDPELKIELSSAEAAINNLPTIQPEKAQLSQEGTTSDLISRQAAIDAINKSLSRVFTEPCGEQILKGVLSAQPEPSIPLSWIEKYIEWLKSFDNEFVNLAAAHISVMVKKWRDEKK